MARQRNTGGYNPYSYGMNRVGQQDLFDPEFANIDFADFQGLNMNLINQNARFAQEVANKRLDELKEAQAKMLEDIQLNKRFDYVEKDFQNKIASVIQNAGNVQLSDAANYTNLNSNLISIKNDPNLKKAVYSSEQAKKAQEILDKDPNLKDRPWDAPMYENYQRFLRGETNDFELQPVYKDVDLVSFWSDNFFKQLTPQETTDLQKYGPYGLLKAKTEGRNVDELIRKIQDFKENTIKNNPEIKSHLNRRSNYAVKGTPPEELPARAQQWQENYLNESISAAASKYAQVNKTIEDVMMDVNKKGAMDQQQIGISLRNAITAEKQADNQERSLNAGQPIVLEGTQLRQGSKFLTNQQQKDFQNELIQNLVGPTIELTTPKGVKFTEKVDFKTSKLHQKDANNYELLIYSPIEKIGGEQFGGELLRRKPVTKAQLQQALDNLNTTVTPTITPASETPTNEPKTKL